MPSLNKVMLIGNLTRDIEPRYTPAGKAVADVRLAINDAYKTKEGQEIKSAVYIDIEVWGKTCENCARFLHKGSPLFIEGRLKVEQWQDQSGKPQSRVKIRAERVQFLGSAKKSADEAI